METLNNFSELKDFAEKNEVKGKVVQKNIQDKTFKILFRKKGNVKLNPTASNSVRNAYKYVTQKIQKYADSGINDIDADLAKIVNRIEADSKSIQDSIGDNRLVRIYSDTDLDRFEDCLRSDGEVRKTLKKQSHFIVNNPVVGLELDEEYDDDRERSEKTKLIQRFKPYRKARKKANQILKNIKFKRKARAAIVNSKGYGRGALEIIRDKEGYPIRANILNSKQMGDVLVNPDDWTFLGIYYFDQFTTKHEKFIPFKNLFYLANDDFHISEGSMYHGLSDIETLIDASETKRILVQKNIKEIAEALYAGFGWVKFLNPDVTETQMQNVMDSIESGAWTGTDLDVEIKVEKIASDSPMLLDIIDAMNLEILRAIDMPSPLGGYENKQNYSNLQQTTEVWKEGPLLDQQQWFIDAVEEQLLEEIMKLCLKNDGFEYVKGESIILNADQQSKLLEPDPNAIQPQSNIKLNIFGQSQPNNINPTENNINATPIAANNNPFIPKDNTNTNKISTSQTFSFSVDGSKTQNPFDVTPIATPVTTTENNQPVGPQIDGMFNSPSLSMPTLIPDLEIPAAKLTLEIEEPNFTTFKEKTESATMILQNKGISIRKYDELLGFPEEAEEAEIRIEEDKQLMMQNPFLNNNGNSMGNDPNNPFAKKGNNNFGKDNNNNSNEEKQNNKQQENQNNFNKNNNDGFNGNT